MSKLILVSACLVGFNCKYNGGNNRSELIVEAFRRGFVVPVCPEQLGGLPTPRSPAKIKGGDGKDVLSGKGKVLTVDGSFKDVTENFLRGAYETLKAAELLGDRLVACILKEKSPSCGVKKIYEFDTDNLKEGMGVTAALLSEKGFKIISSEDTEIIKKILIRSLNE
ncbi:DUF523 domain-containing protein [Phorcysia thermohydrogeniphila]|uniref:Uncharacterized protein YbbK (DUF523 family) n=1 Tax=Phorcysia thermohydrogeniphila TaxID=936138 RepID=A0A4R1GBN7_9BACT|nr:DUF523 domain-containing protein [Phorcysia thermohydrogeniphila]TCK03915.1 uncharacterized protein YbbK (DUF523 family) [Phorcysia thermohydrogeniphila]